MSNKEKTIVNKIDIDEKTAEPIIVKVSESELKEQRKRQLSEYNGANNPEKTPTKSIGTQLKMQGFLGLKAEDGVSKRQKIFKRIFTIIFIVFVIGVLAFTAYNDFFSESENRVPLTWENYSTILSNSWLYFLLALGAVVLCFLTKALKLVIICKSTTGKAHLKTCFETAIVGHYYNNVTPLAVGGQPFEIYHLSRHGLSGGEATSLSISTYFLNQIAYVVLVIVSLSLKNFNPLFESFPTVLEIFAVIGIFTCALIPLLVITFSLMPRVGSTFVHFVMFLGSKLKIVKKPKETTYKTMKNIVQNSRCIKKLATRPLVFISTFLVSFLEHFATGTIAYFTLKAFGFPTTASPLQVTGALEWLFICQICFALSSSVSFIPTPGNSGAADLSFYGLFASGLAQSLAFPAMMTWRILCFYSFIIVGFIFTTAKKKSDLKKIMNNQPLA